MGVEMLGVIAFQMRIHMNVNLIRTVAFVTSNGKRLPTTVVNLLRPSKTFGALNLWVRVVASHWDAFLEQYCVRHLQ